MSTLQPLSRDNIEEITLPPPTRTPPSKWIESGLDALAAGGPDAVRIEQLAQTLGVTKGGFYRHFDDRQELLVAMLDSWERITVDEVVDRVESEGGDARAKLDRLFSLPSSQGKQLLRIELAIRDWARRDSAVAKRLTRIDNRRMDYMRSLFGQFCRDDEEIEARCMLAFSTFIGSHFIAAEHGQHSRADVLRQALERVLA
jgi:AcrR family transcriptional regulator